MTTENPLDQYEITPEGSSRIGWIAAAAALVLVIAAGGWGWSAQRRAATTEQVLAAVSAERDAAMSTAEQRQALINDAETAAQATEARLADLGQQLEAANAEVTRLQDELAAREAAAAAPPTAPAGSLGATAPESEAPSVAAIEPAAAPPAVEPEPAPAPETLTITFDVNSSYLPSLDGRLRDLASNLEPGRSYEVLLTGSVGAGDVEGQSAEEALRYNRWMAERRVDRVAEYLQKNAKVEDLSIKQDFAMNDPSRRVVVQVRPAQD
jgi:hypothetical protein